MKQNLKSVEDELPAIPLQLSRALVQCVEDFEIEGGPVPVERATRLAFANAVYLTGKFPDDAARLRREFESNCVVAAAGLEELEAGLRDFRFDAGWLARIDGLLNRVWASLPAPEDRFNGRIIFGFIAGFHVAGKLPDFLKGAVESGSALESESRFLASRLLRWRTNDWRPRHEPFVEYMAGFYKDGSVVQNLIVGASREVLWVLRMLSDPWGLKFWAEAGWGAGRFAVAHFPDDVRKMVSDLGKGDLPLFIELYRSCVLRSAGGDGTIRPEKAALRFFALRHGRDYAAIYCRGDQPRLIAHAAFDFCFWMGILSTQPIRTEA